MHIFSFYLMGLILSISPCVLPMLPILFGSICLDSSGKRVISLTTTYVLSMATAYALAGVLASLVGVILQDVFMSKYTYFVLSVFFTFLGLSQSGYISLSIPSEVSNAAMKYNFSSYGGAVILGALGALICSPCSAAPILGAIAYSASMGNPAFGGLALFLVGLGIGTPMLVLALTGKIGMDKLKTFSCYIVPLMSVFLFATAIYYMAKVVAH